MRRAASITSVRGIPRGRRGGPRVRKLNIFKSRKSEAPTPGRVIRYSIRPGTKATSFSALTWIWRNKIAAGMDPNAVRAGIQGMVFFSLIVVWDYGMERGTAPVIERPVSTAGLNRTGGKLWAILTAE